MNVIQSPEAMQKWALRKKREGKSIGFVATMGYFHKGHTAMMDRAKKECDLSVVSVFVNPLQFGPGEDYATYPRNIERDQEIAKKHGVDVLFIPNEAQMYPSPPTVRLTVSQRGDVLCGRSRPGHFDGVATVVLKLFSIIQPDRAYFGLKDAQQLAIIEGMVTDFHLPVKIVRHPIVREPDGLAMSSRNVRLTKEERQEATALYQSLEWGKRALEQSAKPDIKKIQREITERLRSELTRGTIDYVDILTYPELKEPAEANKMLIIACAVRFPEARLIDNVIVHLE